MREREYQRSKLYRAEDEALKSLGSPLPTTDDVDRYVAKVLTKAPLVRRYGRATVYGVEVSDGRGRRAACAVGSHLIRIPRWARVDWVVLHELAHIIHVRLDWRPSSEMKDGTRRVELKGGPAHGWQFAAIYLDLVRFAMGEEAEEALKASFKKHKVRYRAKKKVTRTVSPEQIERLKAARAARLAKRSEAA